MYAMRRFLPKLAAERGEVGKRFALNATDTFDGFFPSLRRLVAAMMRSVSRGAEAIVVGVLAALASLCALQASGGEAYSVVAQSTAATAGAGRRPLANRIVSGNLPARPLPQPAPQPSPSDTSASRDAALDRVRQVLSRGTVATEAGAPATAAAASPAGGAEESAPPSRLETSASPLTAGPARLEFDVRESRLLLTEGERLIFNIAVRNVGPTTARRVETALFFADGVEPVKTTGHAAAIASGAVRIEPIESLAPGDTVVLAVTAVGIRAGSVVYRGELACDELPGVIAREGAVRIEPRSETRAP